MGNQNEFQDKEREEGEGMLNNQENGNSETRVFTDAGAEDEDIGPVHETEHILPDENEGDNRFMDDEEEIDDPIAPEDDDLGEEEFEDDEE